MPDRIHQCERAGIEAFIARHGVTRIPAGKSGIPLPRWDERQNRLVQPEAAAGYGNSWASRRKARAFAARARMVREGFEEGLSDQQIGDRLGVAASTVAEHRRKQGLMRPTQPRASSRAEMVVDMARRGFTDRQISAATGLSLSTVEKHRRAEGVPKVREAEARKPGRKRDSRDKATAQRDEELRPLLTQGLTVSQIARRAGCSTNRVRGALRRLGIEQVKATALIDIVRPWLERGARTSEIVAATGVREREVIRLRNTHGYAPPRHQSKTERAKPLIRQGLSNKEVAACVGLTANSVCRVRRELGLTNPKKARRRRG